MLKRKMIPVSSNSHTAAYDSWAVLLLLFYLIMLDGISSCLSLRRNFTSPILACGGIWSSPILFSPPLDLFLYTFGGNFHISHCFSRPTSDMSSFPLGPSYVLPVLYWHLGKTYCRYAASINFWGTALGWKYLYSPLSFGRAWHPRCQECKRSLLCRLAPHCQRTWAKSSSLILATTISLQPILCSLWRRWLVA